LQRCSMIFSQILLLWNSRIQLSLQSESFEQISLNECTLIAGIAFIPNRVEPDTSRESDSETYSRSETV
jgi:hypothetical protein